MPAWSGGIVFPTWFPDIVTCGARSGAGPGGGVGVTLALDTDDVRLSARKGGLRVRGKDTTVRELPIHPQLRTDLQTWLDERPDWPGADTSPALLLNRRGRRLSVRGASGIIRTIAADANLEKEHITAHVGRHTFATTPVSAAAPT
jgi:site-specific recombinase XerD